LSTRQIATALLEAGQARGRRQTDRGDPRAGRLAYLERRGKKTSDGKVWTTVRTPDPSELVRVNFKAAILRH
jgi:hypothetical protein